MDRSDLRLGFLIAYVLAAALHAGMAWCILRRRSRHLEIQLFGGANVALAAWHLTQLIEYVFNVSRYEPATLLLRALQGLQLLLSLLVLVLFFHFFATFERVYRRQAPSLRAAITTHVHRRARFYVPAAYLLLLIGGTAYALDAGWVAHALRGVRQSVGPTSAYLFGGTLLFMTFALFPARPGQEKILVPSLARGLLLLTLATTLLGIALWHDARPRLTEQVLLPILHLHSVLFCAFLALVRYEFSFMDGYVRDALRLSAWTGLVLGTYYAFNRIEFLQPGWGRYATSLGRTGILLLAVAAGPLLDRVVMRVTDKALFDRNVDLEAAVHRLAQRMAAAHSLQQLIDGAARDIARAVHAKSVRILVSRSTIEADLDRIEHEQGRPYRLRLPLRAGAVRVGWLLLGERRNLYPYFDTERHYLGVFSELLAAAIEVLRERGAADPELAQSVHSDETASPSGLARGTAPRGTLSAAGRPADGAAVGAPSVAGGRGASAPLPAEGDAATLSAGRAAAVRDERQLHVLEGELLRARGQARAIREQFDPALVGDVLELAAELAESDPAAALTVLRRLHSAYDYLRSPERTPTTLAAELEFAQDYLALEKLRLRNRLTVTLSYDAVLAHQEVPRRLLQPLIENALLHGLARELREGRILIRALAEGGHCVIVIDDNGRGFPASFDGKALDGEGGLARVRSWLRERFGEDAALHVDLQAEEGARLRIVMPRRDLAGEAGMAAAS